VELQEYRGKRDFSRTSEPPPESRGGEGHLIFVVQKHRARQLHYDFRLELDGVLKSWSVPKGPSLDPQARHLAVMVEDHPVEYANFEGIIPKGEYGAGEVIVWDTGTYSPDEGGIFLFSDRANAQAQIRNGLEKGKISFTLRGHKLKGSWTLVKVKKREKDWLLMKHRDEYASPGSDILQQGLSVLSGRSLDDVKTGRAPVPPAPTHLNPGQIPGARAAPLPSSVSPMLAHLARAPFSSPEWIFEPKLDGYRIITYVNDSEVNLISRSGINVTAQYSSLVPDLSRQPASHLILDGEIIVMDEKGRQCFQCLQQYLRFRNQTEDAESSSYPLIYYVFDILYLNGYDLRGATLRYRKGLLESILRPTNQVRLISYFEKDGEAVYKAAVDNGLEGVLAKHIESKYESGRSRNWLKVKAMLSDEFVIGGYSVAEKGRAQTFSSLLLGYFDAPGKLIFVGHVGSGFDEKTLSELKSRLDALRTEDCPFSEVPPFNAPTTWVHPELVAEVKFSEWTRDGKLRIPVFIRLREDKSPGEIHRTDPVPAPSATPKRVAKDTDDTLEQLQNAKETFTIETEGNKIKLSNLGKVLWPPTASHPPITKRHLLTYIVKASSYFLTHLKDRPLTLTRYPSGIQGKHFFQKHWEQPIPDFIDRVKIREEDNTEREYLVCNNLSTLLWLGQLANLEFHTWFSRISIEPDMQSSQAETNYLLDYPDFIIFDLDPYIYSGREPPGAEPEPSRTGFAKVTEVALWLKEVLDELSLSAFIKTSGKTGLHVYVPIARNIDYKAVRSAAETIGRFLLQRHPAEITMEWTQKKRVGKVFVDHNQNVRGKTLASAYSPRPDPEATVSTPLRWEELGKIYPTDFSLLTLPDRLKESGDLWANILSARRNLKELLGKVRSA
jgi:bifunctional non-homologous end joining protein LigD